MKTDGSYKLAQTDEVAQRTALLKETHMDGLCDFVRDLRTETGYGERIPNFDPLDGGSRARVLFLMEAPGPKAVASGFISRDNPDPTACNLKNFLKEAGIEREQSALWNLVPWYIGNETGSKIRPATANDARQSAGALQRLWPLFPKLQIVVLMGRKAQGAQKSIEEATEVTIIPDLSYVESIAQISRHDKTRFGGSRQAAESKLSSAGCPFITLIIAS